MVPSVNSDYLILQKTSYNLTRVLYLKINLPCFGRLLFTSFCVSVCVYMRTSAHPHDSHAVNKSNLINIFILEI